MAHDSEFRAYQYIQQALKDLEWDIRNPSKGGQVYTQGEFRNHDPLLTDALGLKAPENIVRFPFRDSFCYWVIEAKRSHNQLEKSLREAKNNYSDKINNTGGG